MAITSLPDAAIFRDAIQDRPGDLPGDRPNDLAPVKSDCPDPSVTYIYVVTESGQLYAFKPMSLSFKFIGTIDCNWMPGNPFSMAVDRKGVAYVDFTNGEIGRVSTLNARCTHTSYSAAIQGETNFGMGFSTEGGGPAEKLFISGSSTAELSWLDTTTFSLHHVGKSPASAMELTGSGFSDFMESSPISSWAIPR